MSSTTVGSVTPAGADALQILEQDVRILLDRLDRMTREQLGEQARHHLAVLEHVRHARRHAQVVFQHAELALAVAHDVDAGDVAVDAGRQVDALHLRPVLRIGEHLLGRNFSGLQDLLIVVHIADEGIQRPHPLLESRLERAPFLDRNDPRHDVEGDESLGAGVLAVHREGDADPMKQRIRFRALVRESLVGLLGEPVPVTLAVRTGLPVQRPASRRRLRRKFVFSACANQAGWCAEVPGQGISDGAAHPRPALQREPPAHQVGPKRPDPAPLHTIASRLEQMRTPCQPRSRRRLNGLRAPRLFRASRGCRRCPNTVQARALLESAP